MSDDAQLGKEISFPTLEINGQEILLERDISATFKRREASRPRWQNQYPPRRPITPGYF